MSTDKPDSSRLKPAPPFLLEPQRRISVTYDSVEGLSVSVNPAMIDYLIRHSTQGLRDRATAEGQETDFETLRNIAERDGLEALKTVLSALETLNGKPKSKGDA